MPDKKRKTVVGEVASDRMEKTISVRVTRLERHRMYQKFVRRQSTFKAHDENGEARVGDLVRIAETRPLSKTKRWRLVEIVRRSSGPGQVAADGLSAEKVTAEVVGTGEPAEAPQDGGA